MGDEVVAANAILINLLMLSAYGMDGFAHAVEALVGEAVGARRPAEFIAAVRSCSLWSIVTALVFCIILLAGWDVIPALFTNVEPILTLVHLYYPWLVALPLVTVASYLLDGIFIGATRTREMQNSMLLCVLAVYLPSWYLFRAWENHGLWLAFTVFSAARGITLGIMFYQRLRAGLWLSPER